MSVKGRIVVIDDEVNAAAALETSERKAVRQELGPEVLGQVAEYVVPGILGLGVVEPLPSWGSLLAELQSLDSLRSEPWRLAPAVALLSAVFCFHLAGTAPEEDTP